jgi:probable rRNA maturation factor
MNRALNVGQAVQPDDLPVGQAVQPDDLPVGQVIPPDDPVLSGWKARSTNWPGQERLRSANEVGIEVEISNMQVHLPVDREELARLVRRVLEREGHRRGSISIALVDQATIHGLNRTHLGHDWPTDVISFPLSDPHDPDWTGELVVSAEMADTTAREIGVEPSHELALYIVHGLLHLCGYDDTVESDANRMRRREEETLADLGIPNPFPLVGPMRPQPRGGPVGPDVAAGESPAKKAAARAERALPEQSETLT